MNFVIILFIITSLLNSQINSRFVFDYDDNDYQRTQNEDFERWLSLSPPLLKRVLTTDYISSVFTAFDLDNHQFDQLVNRLSEQERRLVSDIIGTNAIMIVQSVCPEAIPADKGTADDQEREMKMMKMLFNVHVKKIHRKLNANGRNVVDKVIEEMKVNAPKACKFIASSDNNW
ncbi:unnamed protein product [Didymodactylos carnosus]|uniref:Uncharacterized protein n=1 Tax=Didymodactylos carnosus TaxID=1234261 RepID=A0A814SSG7_9BILA|nr:unnamed protein product [Didymodactylos carnosus]CAF1320240.1 unnamed protein product [Didymodactylos carnosus]CAF3915750.1 unnamed protein product [Didymodactylos carnosus]CAF4130116.1 unnamed protein product [Didymodactylos carnosus]